MPTFRILDPFPAYLNLSGQLADGGSLKFYDSGTTTPRDVYGDPDKTVNNGSSILIGSDGRPVVDIWGDGSYRVRLYDADGTLIDEADDVEIQGGSGTAIPALETGKLLSNDGATMQWIDVREVPDPIGSSGKVLGNDGVNPIWQTLPGAPVLPPLPTEGVTAVSGKVVLGKVMIQWGTDSAPATGAHTTSKGVNYPTAYASAPFVAVSRGGTMTSSGFQGTSGAGGVTGTGFSAVFDINVDNASSSFNITSAVPFSWLAIGMAP